MFIDFMTQIKLISHFMENSLQIYKSTRFNRVLFISTLPLVNVLCYAHNYLLQTIHNSAILYGFDINDKRKVLTPMGSQLQNATSNT